jgi:hypothetical protein
VDRVYVKPEAQILTAAEGRNRSPTEQGPPGKATHWSNRLVAGYLTTLQPKVQLLLKHCGYVHDAANRHLGAGLCSIVGCVNRS